MIGGQIAGVSNDCRIPALLSLFYTFLMILLFTVEQDYSDFDVDLRIGRGRMIPTTPW